MPFLTRPHCALYYEVHGDLAGPRTPLVLAHGLGGNHLSWWQQLAHFAPSRACVVFSHRGFALSPEAPGGPGLAGFADDLLALLDHLELHAPILVGQSMGGWATLEVALAQPQRVKALVLSATSGTLDRRACDATGGAADDRAQAAAAAAVAAGTFSNSKVTTATPAAKRVTASRSS